MWNCYEKALLSFQLKLHFPLLVVVKQNSHQNQRKNNDLSTNAVTSVELFLSQISEICDKKLESSEYLLKYKRSKNTVLKFCLPEKFS